MKEKRQMDLARVIAADKRWHQAAIDTLTRPAFAEAFSAQVEMCHTIGVELEAQWTELKVARRTAYLASCAREVLKAMDSASAKAVPDDVFMWSVDWCEQGKPTFVLSAGLMANLLLTDPGKVLAKDVPWPFAAFRVIFPSPDCPVKFLHPDGKTLLPMRALSVLVCDRYPIQEIPAQPDGFEGRHRYFLKAIEGVQPKQSVIVRGYDAQGGSIFHNQKWEPELPVSDWIATGGASTRWESGAHYEMTEQDELALRMVERVAVNLALYLASEDEVTGKVVWSPSDKSYGRSKNWNIGGKVKISREVREAATEVAAGRAATCPAVKHIVRGHFRNQACGAGRLDRKRIYIKPHWRGPDGTEPRERTYVVG